jgi:zinc protease
MTGAAGAETAAPSRVNDWPQAHSDMPADPAVRFAVLPNGMRYAIMRNATPKGEVAIRFRIGAGAFEETPAQAGLAHFLEHMAFRGSTHVPESEVWTGLQRLGMSLGPDTSAYTTETQTFYQLNLPNAEDATVDFGLMRIREIASELSLRQSDMDAERGTVLSEERLRDSPDYRTTKAQRAFFFQGQMVSQRYPIGRVEVIQNAPVSALRDYYNAYYRPERATLIVVGDIDPAVVEAKIKAQFSSWAGVGPAGPDPDLGTVQKRDMETRLVVDPKLARSTLIGWVSPYETPPLSVAAAQRNIVQALALGIVNRRLQVLANSPDRPFVDAAITRRNLVASAKVTFLAVSNDPLHWRAALESAETIRRQALQYGVTQDEVDREVAGQIARYQGAAAAASTRPTSALAGVLLTAADEGDVFSSPAQNLALIQSAVKGLTAAKATAALRDAFVGQGPLVFVSHPIPIEGGEAAVSKAFAEIEAKPVAAPPAEVKPVWPYTHFGPTGRVVDQRTISDLDVHLIRFANGVRLTVKPTRFSADQVLVSVKVGGGILDMPKDRQVVRWAADGDALVLGGLKAITFEDMQSALNAKQYNANFATRDDGFYLSGATRPADLDTQMQVLAAFITAPAWRPEAFERVRASTAPALNALVTSPTGVMQLELPFLLHDADPRWAPPNLRSLSQSGPDDLKALLSGPLANGQIEVTVVGDITVARAIEAVAATFAALPPRPEAAAPSPQAVDVHFPQPTAKPLLLHHRGRADQALALIAWPTIDDLVAPQKARDMRVMEQILQLRLFDELRVVDGAAYEAQTGLEASETFPGYGDVYAFAEVPPGKTDLFFQVVAKIAADLKAHEVSPDELERGRRPRVALFTQNQQNNGYWLGSLSNAQSEPHKLDLIRSTIPDLKYVTPAGVHAAAQAWLLDERAFKLVVMPLAQATPGTGQLGTATLDCQVDLASDRLADCRIVAEDPPGRGVGAQALAAARAIRLDPKSLPKMEGGRTQIRLQAPLTEVPEPAGP